MLEPSPKNEMHIHASSPIFFKEKIYFSNPIKNKNLTKMIDIFYLILHGIRNTYLN